MTSPFTHREANSHLFEHVPQARWGLRLRELATNATASPPEPVEWKPKPTFSQRLRRGTAVPIAAAALVFIAILLISIATVWMRPHSFVQDPATQGALALAGGPDSAGAAGTSVSETRGTGGAADTGTRDAIPVEHKTDRSSTDSDSGSPSLDALYIHVVGEVNQPGVYELEPGSRALAAIEAAGGATEGAVLSGLNLARLLTDGEQLHVPDAERAQALFTSGGAGASPNTLGASGGLVSLNAADQSALESLPRVGPALAQRIIEWRSANGGFQSVEQLLNVSGIGQKTFVQLSDLVAL